MYDRKKVPNLPDVTLADNDEGLRTPFLAPRLGSQSITGSQTSIAGKEAGARISTPMTLARQHEREVC